VTGGKPTIEGNGLVTPPESSRGPTPSWPLLASRAARLRADLPFVLLDAVLVSLVYLGLIVLRFNGSVPAQWWTRFGTFLPIAVAVHLTTNSALGLYGSLWRHAGVREAQRLLGSGLITAAVIPIVASWPPVRLPLAVTLVGPLMATGLVGLSRFQTRLFALNRRPQPRPNAAPAGLRIVILGAGRAGALLAQEMLSDPHTGMVPVAFLDDNPRIHGRALIGIPVVGAIDELPILSANWGLHQALLTIRDASPALVKRAASAAERACIPLRIVPSVDEMLSGKIGLRDVRDLRIDDLLGRHEVVTDGVGIRRVLEGRRVLITGGGGSIGSEIARQVHASGAGLLVLVDHDETHLHDAALDLPGSVQVLADIRDIDQMNQIFSTYRPEVVFHAAAHKHVPILEAFPAEALRTNVIGTANLLSVARAHGTERLILLSTDKAVQPTSAMGASKRLAERLLVATNPGRRWCAVRFGNVLASRGSVVPTFAQQIAKGGPVTVTDDRMTRYFMSISEAVQLVLQSAAMADGGEVFMLDMGEPVVIMDLARRMIRLSGRREGSDVEIRVVGRRPGEKLQEELRHPEEHVEMTEHPAVSRIHPSDEDPDDLIAEIRSLEEVARRGDPSQLASALVECANGRRKSGAERVPGVQVIDISEIDGRESAYGVDVAGARP
jgi:FlaA1/EpsC-like NDP-sugar epimerase